MKHSIALKDKKREQKVKSFLTEESKKNKKNKQKKPQNKLYAFSCFYNCPMREMKKSQNSSATTTTSGTCVKGALEKYGSLIWYVNTGLKLNTKVHEGWPLTLIIWKQQLGLGLVSWKVTIVVQEILLQSEWQRNQWDFPASSCITSVEVRDKKETFNTFSGIQTSLIKVNAPVTSAAVWVHCYIADADVWLSCCGICTRCFDFFWMLAFEVGRAVEQMSPDVQKTRGYQHTVNKGESRRCPVYIPLEVFYLQLLQGPAFWNHQGILVSEKQTRLIKTKS